MYKYQPAIKLRYLFLSLILSILWGCNSTRLLEIKQINTAFKQLGFEREKRDNVLLYKEAASWLNTPHLEGGTSKAGTDCSFLVQQIIKAVYQKDIERNSAAIFKNNCRKIPKHLIKEGDLVFFNTSGKLNNGINHVGIYLKNNKFLHNSTSKGVIVSDLSEDYYAKCWVCAGRVK